ncbi:MAG: 4-phosphoerythronate dehydrogenase [Porticoccaceae bacterium]|nr:4-phosphoerythronate dehydrogenase [Porticoccaceae bacterium]MBT7376143.1 4-phosphoerythronate dehydrogenase [Porticoccaceae bacterium]
MKIIADQNMPLVKELFSEFGNVELLPGREICNAHLLDADLLLVRSVTRVDEELLAGTKVRFVGSATIGVDHVDTAFLSSAGIEFAHAPGCNAEAVVQYDLAVFCQLVPDWLTKTIGIVGCGNVGGRLYQRLLDLGVNCVVYDPFLDKGRVADLVEFDTIIDCDIICLHTPLTRGGKHPTYHLFNADVIARLKPDSVLINAGRGAVVDNKALYEAFRAGLSARVVLDVWEPEPLIDLNLLPFIAMGTPHIAGYSHEGRINGTRMIFEAFKGWAGVSPEVDCFDASMQQPKHLQVNSLSEGILASYDPALDSERLAFALRDLDPGSTDVATAFDRLRREYPVRREFSFYQVAETNGQSESFKTLGFTLGRNS